MAKEVLEMEVKSNIGEVAKDTKELTNEASNAAGEFQIMGVSLNGVKKGFASAAVTAKGMFGSIKSGLISTGIGAFVVLIGSLVAFFTKTKKGAELLEVAFAGIGAAINVITDRVAKFGGAIVKLFKGDVKGALGDVKGAFSGIGTEIANDTRQAIALKQALQNLTDEQRNLNVEVAQSIAFIEQQKLIAEDITKTYAEREEAATKAFNKETELESKRIELAEEAVRIEKERQSTIVPMAEDLDALADLEINLANVRQESAGRQISLQNFLNGLRNEELSKLEEIKAAEIERFEGIEKLVDKRIELIDKLAKAEDINFEKKKTIELSLQELSEKRIEWDAMTQKEKLNLTKNTLNDLTKIAGEETETGKALAITATTIDTFQSAQASYKSLAGIPVIGPALGGIAAAAAVAMGLKNIAAIRGANSSGGGGGGGNISAPNISTPAPQMMSGAFDISGGVAPEPLQAYVLTDEMTNSQNQLANIRRRATI